MQNYHILPSFPRRNITLCGNNIYPAPDLHPDRIMEEHDLFFIPYGTWSVAVDDLQFPYLTAGDALLLRSGVRHRGITNCSPNTRTQFIHFKPLALDRYMPVSSSTLKAASKDDNYYLPTLIHCKEISYMEELFANISNVFWSQREDKDRKLNLLLNLILNELSHYALYSNLPNEDESCSIIVKMFRENPSVTYSVEELADMLGMSPRTLSYHFSETMGTSIRQYQINLKLEQAYTALSGSGAPVKEIAMQYGFCDPYYFSRMFKKKYGVSPNSIKDRAPSENLYRIYK